MRTRTVHRLLQELGVFRSSVLIRDHTIESSKSLCRSLPREVCYSFAARFNYLGSDCVIGPNLFHRPSSILVRSSIEQNRSIPDDLRQHGRVRTRHRKPEMHRICHGQSPPFKETREHETVRKVIKRNDVGFIDITEEADLVIQSQSLRLAQYLLTERRHSAGTHEVHAESARPQRGQRMHEDEVILVTPEMGRIKREAGRQV